MAKAKSNKSQKIRDYFAENPEAKAKDVVTALGAKGVTVTESLVYGVKGAMKERAKRKKRVVKAAMATLPAATGIGNGMVAKTDALTMIREVKALAAKAGGYGKLKELVDALAE